MPPARRWCAPRADKETVDLIRSNLTSNQMLIWKSCPVTMTTRIRKKEARIVIKTGLILPNGHNGANRSGTMARWKNPLWAVQWLSENVTQMQTADNWSQPTQRSAKVLHGMLARITTETIQHYASVTPNGILLVTWPSSAVLMVWDHPGWRDFLL